jgi:hypothetical protein
MNPKETTVYIVTAMLVMAMFASSAMAITVDGRIDPSDEWDASWKLADDLNDEPPLPLPNGFNISAVWQHYNLSEDKLYFRYDTVGIAGDASGNGNPHLYTPPDGIEEWGVGLHEAYVVGFDVDNDDSTGAVMMGYPDSFDGFDLVVHYNDNVVTANWYGGVTAPSSFVAKAAIATEEDYTHNVEFSINNVSEFMDWRYYRIYGFAGSLYDTGNPEDPLTEPIEVLEFDFNWTGICCYNMSFTGISCGNIVNHTWDFGDGTPLVTISGPPVSPIWHQYTRGGPPKYNVVLSGCNQKSCASISKAVYVDNGPTAKATRTPGMVYVNTPTSVKFDGSASHADPSGDPLRTITYEWSFSDGTYDSGSIVYKTVKLGSGATLSATLTVNDSHCEDDVKVYVTTKPPQEVPLLTPAGMFALIGMMCIVGAGRVLTKGRRL